MTAESKRKCPVEMETQRRWFRILKLQIILIEDLKKMINVKTNILQDVQIKHMDMFGHVKIIEE